MSKVITKLEQLEEGLTNPGTGMFEQPIWKITLQGGEERLLGKHKMEEYISKSFEKAIHRFKRWKVLTKTSETHVYVIIFSDRTHEMLTPNQVMDRLYTGHLVRKDEKYKYIESELAAKDGHSPIFIPGTDEPNET